MDSKPWEALWRTGSGANDGIFSMLMARLGAGARAGAENAGSGNLDAGADAGWDWVDWESTDTNRGSGVVIDVAT